MTENEAVVRLMIQKEGNLPGSAKQVADKAIEALTELQKYRLAEEQGDIIRLPYRVDTKTILYNGDGDVYILNCYDKADADNEMAVLMSGKEG